MDLCSLILPCVMHSSSYSATLSIQVTLNSEHVKECYTVGVLRHHPQRALSVRYQPPALSHIYSPIWWPVLPQCSPLYPIYAQLPSYINWNYFDLYQQICFVLLLAQLFPMPTFVAFPVSLCLMQINPNFPNSSASFFGHPFILKLFTRHS